MGITEELVPWIQIKQITLYYKKGQYGLQIGQYWLALQICILSL